MKQIAYIFGSLILIVGGIVIYFVHEVVAFTPASDDEIRGWLNKKTYEDLEWPLEEIEFSTFTDSINKTGEPLTLRGIFIPGEPSGKKKKKEPPVVIVLHGKGSNRIGVLRFGYMFHKLGFNVLIYDQRHHGKSDGDYTTYGYYESHDVKQAISYLEERGVNTDKLGIFGESFGAATSLMAGAIEEKIDFVIADSSYIDMENAVKDNAWRMNYIPEYPIPYLGFSLAAWLAEFDPWSVSPINALREINKPVLITHCDLDVWAYPEYAYQLYEASNKELTELKMFSDCEHVEAYGKYTEQYEKMVEGFLLRHVPDFL